MTNATNGSASDAKSVLDDKISLISITVSTFGGYRRATRDAIYRLGGKLPDCKAITEGSLKVFPSDPLAEGHTIRRGLFRKMAKRGIKALGSANVFAIPRVELEEAEKEIAAAKVKFDAFTAGLEQNYDSHFENHIKASIQDLDQKEAIEVEAMLRANKFDKAVAIGRLQFSSTPFLISPVKRDGQTVEDGVAGIVRGLGRQLFEEISDDMAKVLKKESFGKNRVGQRIRVTLQSAMKKMDGLRFLDERMVSGAVKLITETVAMLPPQGFIQDTPIDTPFSKLRRLVEMMSDPDELVNAASKAANGVATLDVLFPPKAIVATPVATQPKVKAKPVAKPPVATAAGNAVASLPRSLPPVPPRTMPKLPKAATHRMF